MEGIRHENIWVVHKYLEWIRMELGIIGAFSIFETTTDGDETCGYYTAFTAGICVTTSKRCMTMKYWVRHCR